ncbi:hypothetical protein IC582_000739 [Cucumis melo]|uniref:PORR domain-containing protein n=1 Tax=Cucumis melo TaxID=3656 RepID=A0A9I9DVA6_CUCME
MDSKLLLYSPKASLSISVPFILGHKSYYSVKSQFWGKNLDLRNRNDNLRKAHDPFQPIRAVVKRRKELPFDNVIQRDKKLKLVMRIRKILVQQPDRVMSLKELGKFRRDLGLEKKRRLIALLKKFPAVFEVVEEGAFSLKFKLTAEAERLYLEELKIRNEMEGLLVIKLRKLLMMSADKRILLEKIAHLRTDFGLPLEFRDTICHRYPQYFRVVATERGPALELTHWDPELAVSAAELAEEENRARELEEKNLIIDRPLKFNRVKLPKGLNLSKSEMRKISQFRDIPYISPYSDFSGIKAGTPQKEKHACGVVHEILNLTLEKRTLVDHLTHFREEFRFSQQLRGMLIRHPDMFYVSLKGDRDSVFLREAYRDSQLIDKDRLLIIKEKLRALVAVPRFRSRGASNGDTKGGDTNQPSDMSGEEWSDVDNLLDDDDDEFDDDEFDDDNNEAFEDDWSDEDDTPPSFNGDQDGESINIGSRKQKQVNDLQKVGQSRLSPVLPDGRPRERW